jgi:hypothetical protein
MSRLKINYGLILKLILLMIFTYIFIFPDFLTKNTAYKVDKIYCEEYKQKRVHGIVMDITYPLPKKSIKIISTKHEDITPNYIRNIGKYITVGDTLTKLKNSFRVMILRKKSNLMIESEMNCGSSVFDVINILTEYSKSGNWISSDSLRLRPPTGASLK